MDISTYDVKDLRDQLDARPTAIAQGLVAGLAEELGGGAPRPVRGALRSASTIWPLPNRVYLSADEGTSDSAREEARLKRGPALPGLMWRCS